MITSQLGRTMEAMAILASMGDIEFVEKQAKKLKAAYDPKVQEAYKYLSKEEQEELLLTM